MDYVAYHISSYSSIFILPLYFQTHLHQVRDFFPLRLHMGSIKPMKPVKVSLYPTHYMLPKIDKNPRGQLEN